MNTRVLFLFFCSTSIAFGVNTDRVTAAITGFAAMGDSVTGGNLLSNSWVPHLATTVGLDFGGTGNPYNFAIGGSNTRTLLTQNQHTDVRDRVQSGDVDLPFLWIGGNNFRRQTFGRIASGELSGSELWAEIDSWVGNIQTAIDTILPAGPTGMVVVGLPDFNHTPQGRANLDTPDKQERFRLAVTEYNDKLLSLTMSRDLTYVDMYAASQVMGALDTFLVGGVEMEYDKGKGDPYHFYSDKIHPNAVGSGIIANIMLSAVNEGYGTSYPLMTDLQLLTNAGLQDEYTGETFSLPYSSFVATVPEPTSGLFLASLVTGMGAMVRRRK